MTTPNRPDFADFCRCASIMINAEECLQYERAGPFLRISILEQSYKRGAEYDYNLHCKICGGTGVLAGKSRQNLTVVKSCIVRPSYDDLCDAIDKMVNAQHAGTITTEMFEAWNFAREILSRAKQ